VTDDSVTGRGYRAVEILYHAYLAGLILTTVTLWSGTAREFLASRR